jgi:hypothetical protein
VSNQAAPDDEGRRPARAGGVQRALLAHSRLPVSRSGSMIRT